MPDAIQPSASPARRAPLRAGVRGRASGWVLGGVLLLLAAPGRAEEAPPPKHGSVRPFHVSVGSGVFLPWDGDQGYSISGTFHRGFGSDRFWVGGELEFRRFEADLKRDYRPDLDTWAVRFQFQYHPFPTAVVSPYVGIAVGFVVNRVEQNRASSGEWARDDVSGGSTLLGLAGIEVPVPFGLPLQLFAEGRLGNTSDWWQRKHGNLQLDQIDGFTGLAGLRVRFY